MDNPSNVVTPDGVQAANVTGIESERPKAKMISEKKQKTKPVRTPPEITKTVQNKVQSEWKEYGFFEPEMSYSSNITFIITSDESLCCTPSSLTTIISASQQELVYEESKAYFAGW